jgi:hypothetical protein
MKNVIITALFVSQLFSSCVLYAFVSGKIAMDSNSDFYEQIAKGE